MISNIINTLFSSSSTSNNNNNKTGENVAASISKRNQQNGGKKSVHFRSTVETMNKSLKLTPVRVEPLLGKQSGDVSSALNAGNRSFPNSTIAVSEVDWKSCAPEHADTINGVPSPVGHNHVTAKKVYVISSTELTPATPAPGPTSDRKEPDPIEIEHQKKKRLQKQMTEPVPEVVNNRDERSLGVMDHPTESSAKKPKSNQEDQTEPSSSSATVPALDAVSHDNETATSPSSLSSPHQFDNVQFKSRFARSWGLTRPEDFTSLSAEERRGSQFRLANHTLWLRSLNNAVVEKDFRRVAKLLSKDDHNIRTDMQFGKLARCAIVLRDWKTLAVLLCFGRRHLISERDTTDAARDVVAFGTSVSASDVAQQQICLHLAMCSFSKLPRHNLCTFDTRELTVDDLCTFCRNDDVISLAAGLFYFLDHARVVTTRDFCELETKVRAPSSIFVEDTDLDEDGDQQEKRRMTIDDSYFTPVRSRRDSSDDAMFDEDLSQYYSQVAVPSALNGRNASLIEFAAMICAPHCVTFLAEVASGRLSV